MADHNVDWEACADDDCVGVRLPTGGKCWAHAARLNLSRALKRLGDGGRLDARGVPPALETVREERLQRVFHHAEARDPGAHAQHVRVVVLASDPGLITIGAMGGADAGDLVGGDRHSDAAAADQ